MGKHEKGIWQARSNQVLVRTYRVVECLVVDRVDCRQTEDDGDKDDPADCQEGARPREASQADSGRDKSASVTGSHSVLRLECSLERSLLKVLLVHQT